MISRTQTTPLLLSCSLLTLVAGCNFVLGQALVGSGVPMTEGRDTEPFVGLDLGGAMEAEVSIGEPQSIEITGDDNIIPIVVTEVRNGRLRIWTDHKGSLRMKKNLKAKIVTPNLEAVDASGACRVVVDGVAADRFDVELSGASTLTLTGSCQELTADISGASKLKCENLESESVDVEVSGASSARVNATDSLKAEASGASSIRYGGQPANTEIDKSGASSIKPDGN